MIVSGAGLFLSAEAHKVLVCCGRVCQAEKLWAILIRAPGSVEAGAGWRPRRVKSQCGVGRAQWAVL